MGCLVLSVLLVPHAGSTQERIVGLVELPAIHAAVNEGRADVVSASVAVHAEPNENSPEVVAVRDWRQLETREHGYEQVSAAVYALAYAPGGGPWYKVRFAVGDETGYGWVEHSEGVRYREVHALVSSGLAFIAEGWDRRLRERPAADAPATTLERDGQSDAVRVIDVHYAPGSSDAWYLLAVVRGECTGQPLEVLATGWIPAYTAEGENSVWFRSRGC
jgi:hypothetical protein